MYVRKLYRVQPGDTPAKIAANFTGNSARMSELIQANTHKPHKIVLGITTFKDLSPGERLFLPWVWRTGRIGDDVTDLLLTETAPQTDSPPEMPPETGGQGGNQGGGYEGGSAPPVVPPATPPVASTQPPSQSSRLPQHEYSRVVESVQPPSSSSGMSAGGKVAIAVVGIGAVGGLWYFMGRTKRFRARS